MKACMLAYTFYESDNRVRRYAETLVEQGYDVEAIVLRRSGQRSSDTLRGVRIFRIQKRRRDEKGPLSYFVKVLSFFFRSMWFLAARSSLQPYDLIHVHSVPDFEVFATLIPRIMGARIILDIHDIVPELYASKFGVSPHSLIFRLLLLVEKLSTAYADHVIIANDLWREKIVARSVEAAKCTALINYPDISIFSKQERKQDASGEFILCYPGTLNRHQGLDVAIRAMALLHTIASDVRLLIIGDGPERRALEDMVREQRMESCVSILDAVPLEEVAETMARVDVGIVPKRKDSFGDEAFSTKIMEFMAIGVPVIASRTKVDQYYFNDELIEFAESDNASDFAAKILALRGNPERRESLRRRASTFVAENCWEVKKARYLALVEELWTD